jgi:hypothetical protein
VRWRAIFLSHAASFPEATAAVIAALSKVGPLATKRSLANDSVGHALICLELETAIGKLSCRTIGSD